MNSRIVEMQNFDEERALYHLIDATVRDCTFAGPADGESVLKECRNIAVENCRFSLRYPFGTHKNFSFPRRRWMKKHARQSGIVQMEEYKAAG